MAAQMQYSDPQLAIIEMPVKSSVFLTGPAGSGKTAAAVQRMNYLIEKGIEGRKILLYFPQRNLGARFQQAIRSTSFPGSSQPTLATYGGLARRLIDLFWPSVVSSYSFFQPENPPTFLTLESSLFFLSEVVEPLITDQGFFSSVTIQRNRLYSQILDNLNKSAIHGFPHTEIADRLLSSWIGDPSQEIVYQQAQETANIFRDYCLRNNLFDYSLQIELFTRMLEDLPLVSAYLRDQFSHLIYDNAEEDVPVSHDFIQKLLPGLSSSLIVFDQNAGYRIFLGASPESGQALSAHCSQVQEFRDSFTNPPRLKKLADAISLTLNQKELPEKLAMESLDSFSIEFFAYYPQMVAWIAEKISSLIAAGVDPAEIVVLAPFLSDSLRFMLVNEFDKLGIPSTSHRPSRSLRDEPVTQCLLNLSACAHPEWGIHPSAYELAQAFLQTFRDIDLTRSYLLARGALQSEPAAANSLRLAPFEAFEPDLQQRITYLLGGSYQTLLNWLDSYHQSPPLALDHFLSRIFSELLTREEFGFHDDLSKGRITAQIIDSYSKFRKTAADVLELPAQEAGRAYYRMVKSGVLANQYLRSWTEPPPGKVLLAPAYTFLLNNKPADYQFWLDIGSRGWHERIYQPLTNPHVLHRDWVLGKLWTDAEETALNIKTLECLATGLIRRCRKGIFGCLTETDERGYEQKGLLLKTMSRLRFQVRKFGSPSEGNQL